jgi:hypothetical protein
MRSDSLRQGVAHRPRRRRLETNPGRWPVPASTGAAPRVAAGRFGSRGAIPVRAAAASARGSLSLDPHEQLGRTGSFHLDISDPQDGTTTARRWSGPRIRRRVLWLDHAHRAASSDPAATKAWCATVLGWTFKPSFATPGGTTICLRTPTREEAEFVRTTLLSAGPRPLYTRPRCFRQRHHERRTTVEIILDGNRAAVRLHNAFRDAQAKAIATGLLGP